MPVLAILIAAPQSTAAETLTAIPGGTFTMGDAAGDANETPRRMTVVPFRVSPHEVTNREFADFVAVTGHATDPEPLGEGYIWNDKWRSMKGADWRHPHEPNSSIEGKANHPVVQVSKRDAAAYCAWQDRGLPTEAELEFAARGTDGCRYA